MAEVPVAGSTGPPALHLRALGPRAALVAGAPAPAEVLWQKHFALLVYLACSPDLSRSRGQLTAMLWPDRSEARARHSLNEALHRLRACLGPERLQSDGETVMLSRTNLTVDAWASGAEQPGEFLEGFALEDSQPFDEWVEGERLRRRDAAITTLVSQARQLLAEGLPARAAAVGRTARTMDPLAEAPLRLVVEALALQGDQGGALGELREYRQRLAEIDEQPGPELLRLAERIRSGALEVNQPAAVAVSRLVGRGPALASLTERLPLPGLKSASLLVVLGESGTGKTRMLTELRDRAALAGVTVASARALASDQGRPGSTLRSLFRGGLLRASGLLGVDPLHLRRLAGIVPEIGDRFPPEAPADIGELSFSFAEALAAIAEEAPVLLLLDDAHLADGASLGIVKAALERLDGKRVTLLLTAARHDVDAAPELLQLQAELGRSLPGTAVTLQPFDHSAMEALVEDLAPWADTGEARDRLVRRMLHETSGNPFLAVTLLRGLADVSELRDRAVEWPVPRETLDSPLPQGIPQLIQNAVVAQSARLAPASRDLLVMAATIGAEVDLQILSALAGLAESEVADRLEGAERLQLIEATESGYGFPGVIVAQVLRQAWLTAGRRRELRRRAGELLAPRSDPGSRLARLELLGRELPPEALAAEALALGEELLGQGDRRRARRALALLAGISSAVPGRLSEASRALRDRLDQEPRTEVRTRPPAASGP